MSRPLIHRGMSYAVTVEARVEATVVGHMHFTDAEIRDLLQLDDDDEITLEVIEDYVRERCDDDADFELRDIDDYLSGGLTFDIDRQEVRMVVPASFVPLPGLELG